MTASRHAKKNRALHCLGTASMVLLMNAPGVFHGNRRLAAVEAFSNPTSTISSAFPNAQIISNRVNTILSQKKQSIVCHTLSKHHMMDSEDGYYFDLSDTQLLEHSRIYRNEILKLNDNNKDLSRLEELQEEIKLIRNVLMERHMGLVGYIANSYRKRVQNLTYEDLIQEGVMGLARAYEKYNPEKNTKFSSYATFWIRARISRVISERDNLVRIPEHVSRAISKINSVPSLQLRTDVIATTKIQDEQDIQDLAAQAGLTEKELKLALKVKDQRQSGGYVAFEPWMISKQRQQSVPFQQSLESFEVESDRDQLKDALSKFLRPKEMEALSWRYGLLECDQVKAEEGVSQFRDYEAEMEEDLFGSQGILKMVDVKSESKQTRTKPKPQIQQKGRWGEAMSFKEVGNQMAVSAEYGRRLCSQALKKLQRAAEEGLLEPALLMS